MIFNDPVSLKLPIKSFANFLISCTQFQSICEVRLIPSFPGFITKRLRRCSEILKSAFFKMIHQHWIMNTWNCSYINGKRNVERSKQINLFRWRFAAASFSFLLEIKYNWRIEIRHFEEKRFCKAFTMTFKINCKTFSFSRLFLI